MPSCVRSLALLALGLGMASVSKAAIGDSGTGSTTRYWVCPSWATLTFTRNDR